jgi:hypothetical protein
MNFSNAQQALPLVGGMVVAQRYVAPPEVVASIASYRHGCRLAWRLRRVKNLTRRTLAEEAGLYTSHTSDYFSPIDTKRELPARHVAAVERVLGNTVISQYLARCSQLTVVEEWQAAAQAQQMQVAA